MPFKYALTGKGYVMAEDLHDIATVQEGLEKLSQAECLVALDEAMSRRGHNKTDLRWEVRLWRQERCAWRDARDRRADAKEAEAET
jgi:hypothetical protein